MGPSNGVRRFNEAMTSSADEMLPQGARHQEGGVPGRTADGTVPISAFVSWAHSHNAWTAQQAAAWQQTILYFATALRQVGGIDADLDLWHKTSFLSWVEDAEQTVSARRANPRIAAAITALQVVRSRVFGGISSEPRARAAPWARAFLGDALISGVEIRSRAACR